MLKFVTGDMFGERYDIRVNTVNCVGVMGAGVALAFKSKYPEMFSAYKKACDEGRIKPGEVDVWRTVTEWIVNFPTKRHWRERSRYEDIEAGLTSLRDYLQSQGSVRVALPALGCGHGGLEWSRVAAMIKSSLEGLDAEIDVFEPSDSREAGERAAEQRRTREEAAGLIWSDIDATTSKFPKSLIEAGVERISVMGDAKLLACKAIAVLSSSRPAGREEEAGLACVEAFRASHATLSFPFGGRVAHAFAAAHLDSGGQVVLWAAEGQARVRVPANFHDAVRRGRLAVVTTSARSERWSTAIAQRSAALQATVAAAVLITGDQRELLRQLRSSPRQHAPVFFVWYGETSKEAIRDLEAVGGFRIGRARESGLPNVRPILAALNDQGRP